jgi:hypothetical protein
LTAPDNRRSRTPPNARRPLDNHSAREPSRPSDIGTLIFAAGLTDRPIFSKRTLRSQRGGATPGSSTDIDDRVVTHCGVPFGLARVRAADAGRGTTTACSRRLPIRSLPDCALGVRCSGAPPGAERPEPRDDPVRLRARRRDCEGGDSRRRPPVRGMDRQDAPNALAGGHGMRAFAPPPRPTFEVDRVGGAGWSPTAA